MVAEAQNTFHPSPSFGIPCVYRLSEGEGQNENCKQQCSLM